MSRSVMINDPTLRDGSHAVRHQITLEQVRLYANAAGEAGIDIIEVGHGNGLGASSGLLGMSLESDEDILRVAKSACGTSKLGVHFIPGLGKSSDLDLAIECGVDVFRVASHCSEANLSLRYIESLKSANKVAYGVLMMVHMINDHDLMEQSQLLMGAGADGIILMDSAGNLDPEQVIRMVSLLSENLDVQIGFHAHNNLGLAVANSLSAVEAGADIIDGCSKGFGAGAGNTPIEMIVALLERRGYLLKTSFNRIIKLIEVTERILTSKNPEVNCQNIASGLYGLFSGFAPHVMRIAETVNVDPYKLFESLASRKLVAGQEDLILEEAYKLANAVSS